MCVRACVCVINWTQRDLYHKNGFPFTLHPVCEPTSIGLYLL